MALFDVVFPYNLSPLTYKGNEGLMPGMLVNAEIKKTIKTGIILRESLKKPEGRIKDIESSVGDAPIFTDGMLKLISWMSDYYLVTEGIVLKEMWGATDFKGLIEPLSREIKKKYYKTFLIHAPERHTEMSILKNLISLHRNIIILSPEIAYVKHISKAIRDIAGERLCSIHSGITKAMRQKAIGRLLRGESDIVIGIRSAIFAPLGEVSVIVVVKEESPSYKKEDGLRYHTRDVAIMRGYFEGASVVLSSTCPSVESLYNAGIGKYTLIKPPSVLKKPSVKVIDMRTSQKTSPYISKGLFDRTLLNIKENNKTAFLINRKGYSVLICEDCGYIETCKDCQIPLVFYKSDKTLRCHYCGFKKTAGGACTRCNGSKLRMVGAGIEKIEEDVRDILKTEPLRLQAGRRKSVPIISEGQMIVGTRLIARMPELKGRLSLIGVLNGDSYLQAPDFRAVERAFQELIHLTENLTSDGHLIIQTRMPHNPLFKYIKNYDFEKFLKDELSIRRTLRYPPFSKMALITSDKPSEISDFKSRILNLESSLEVLGPVKAHHKKGRYVWKMLIKAIGREDLRKGLRAIGASNKGVTIDIDPISF
ncbi:MAG: primosomal protein N' [Nitrospirae bacterium]|nr:primosomal protein N' [Nitrospirota bacterium]